MPKLLQKLTLSFLSALIVIFSFAPYFSVKAADCNPIGATRTCPGQTACVVGLDRYCCTSATACTQLQSGTSNTSNTTTAPVPAPKGTWYNANFSQWFAKVYDPNVSPESEIFGERYTAAQVQWVVFGLLSLLINTSGDAGTQVYACLMSGDLNSCQTAIQNAIDNIKLSDSSGSTWATAWSVDRISGIGYIRQKIDNFHLIPEANAQGVGFSAASPIQSLWVAIRNLAFALIILVVIAMSFMIMFRVKISPQVAITVQSALPKIIGALILITFSYAIAGFMIDLMYVVMGILATFISSSGISSLSAPELFAALNTSSVILLMLSYLFYFTLGSIVVLFASGPLGAVAGTIFSVIILIVLLIIVIISIFRILWLLLVTFVNILIQIAFGPLLILVGTVSPIGGFGGWLKELAANLMVYPTAGFLFFLSFFFLAQAYGGLTGVAGAVGGWIVAFMPFKINPGVLGTTSSWSPPLTVGAKGMSLLWLGASFAVMALIPKTAEIIKGLITGKPFAYGTAIGEALGAPGRGAMATMGAISSTSRAYTGLQELGIIKGRAAGGGESQIVSALRELAGELRSKTPSGPTRASL